MIYLLSFLIRPGEHQKVTIFFAPGIYALLFVHFEPLRLEFFSIINLPKPEMSTSSFDSSVFFIISRVVSTDLVDFVSGRETVLQTS